MAEVVWHEKAQQELQTVGRFLGGLESPAARAFMRRVAAVVQRLTEFPQSGRVVTEFGNEFLREAIIGNYRLVYRISHQNLTILAIRHGARLLTLESLPEVNGF